MSRTTGREFRVGLIVVLALAGFGLMLLKLGVAPDLLVHQQHLDVIFRDGQGIREGSPVRVAGIDIGRVHAVDLAEVDGELRARVRIAIPNSLASRLKQDVKITVQASITGQNCINVISSGRSEVALVAGQVIQGVETSFFDPVLEQVGLGPVERSHLSHTIAEIRQTVDSVGPRARQIVNTLQETTAGLKETTDSVRPVLEASVTHVESLTKQLQAAAPKVDASLVKVEAITQKVVGILDENQPKLNATLANVADLTSTVSSLATSQKDRVEGLIVGLEDLKKRSQRVLYNAEVMTDQGAQILTRNRPLIDRSILNVRDATDWADQLVQKIYSNPFLISPLYKPRPEDLRSQMAIDTARLFLKGAKELSDNVKTLESIQTQPTTPERKEQFDALYKRSWTLMEWMNQTERQLAESLKPQVRR